MLDDRFYVSRGPLTIADIIEGLEVMLPDPKFLDETITHTSPLSGALAQSIVFVASKKALKDIADCKATACFVTEPLSGDVGAQHIIPIISKTPRAHFARAMALLGEQKRLDFNGDEPNVSASSDIHPSAVIGCGATIGGSTVISPNCVIGPGVEIGENCHIGPNVTIEAAILGNNCIIKAGAVIGGSGFGVDNDERGSVNIPHFGRVIIGDNVSIGANSCVDRGQLGDTRLGDDVKIDNLVQVAHNVEIGQGSRIAALGGISGSCKIGRNVMLGGAVGIADHISIGDNANIAAGSGIMKDIPSGEYWGGSPAQPMKSYMREVATMRRLARKSRNIKNEI